MVSVAGATGASVPAQLSGTSRPLLAVGVVAALAAATLLRLRPPVTRKTVLAFTPWMVAGAAMHALTAVGAPAWDDGSLFATPTVYATTFAVAGGSWALLSLVSYLTASEPSAGQYLTASGAGAALVALGVALGRVDAAADRVLWAGAGLVAALLVAVLAYVLVSLVYSRTVVQTGLLGWLVVFGQALDAATVAVAVDVFGTTAEGTLAAPLLARAADLPTQPTVGVGWTLVTLKILLALVGLGVVAALLSRRLRDRPTVPYLLLGLAAAAGVGPGIARVLLLLAG
jgi:uncharacterized membrane protein